MSFTQLHRFQFECDRCKAIGIVEIMDSVCPSPPEGWLPGCYLGESHYPYRRDYCPKCVEEKRKEMECK